MTGTVQAPTKIRLLDQDEWKIVNDVFGSTLPMRARILVTNATGAGGAPFTIPTSLLIAVFGAAGAAAISTNPLFIPIAAVGAVAGAISSFLNSATPIGYLMNVGKHADGSMAKTWPGLLVHETTHVWQGKNSIFAASYVVNSVIHQCKGMSSGGGLSGRNSAYAYTAGAAWSSYSAEQQASIVEDWYDGGSSGSSPLFGYIRDYVRKGKA